MPYRPNPYENISLAAPTVPVVGAQWSPAPQSNAQWGFGSGNDTQQQQMGGILQSGDALRKKYFPQKPATNQGPWTH